MNLWQDYLRPKSVEEALAGLTSAPGPACPIAGGTDLLLDIQQGRRPPLHTLVDLNTIPEMTIVEIRSDRLFIGAAVPLSHIVASELIQEHAQALIEAAQLVGGPQIRNAATLGGNVVHALPAADGTIALIVLGAQAELADLQGRRLVPVINLFLGPGKSRVDSERELLVGFYLPLRKAHQASAFRRIMRAQGIALPILNVSVWLERKSKFIQDVRIAVGPGGPVPWRADLAEGSLRGHAFNSLAMERARQAVLKQVGFRTSAYRASAEYRAHLVGMLLGDALETAWKRAEMDECE
jgi:CO/xanthine dehydrogenase FAD-binding subunit